MLMTLREEITL